MTETLMQIFTKIMFAGLPSLITGLMLAYWNRKQTHRDKEADKREAQRREYEIVQISLMVATAELSRANAVALRDGKTNGEMKEGLRQYNNAMEKFKDFEHKRLAESQS